ncbi:hypothetical protein Tco_0320069 [Tanacetum coccineum]
MHYIHDYNRPDHFLQSSEGQSGGPSMYRAGRKIQASRPEEDTTRDLSSTRKNLFQFHLNTLGNLRDLTLDDVFDLKKQDESTVTSAQEPSKWTTPPSYSTITDATKMKGETKIAQGKSAKRALFN